MLIPRYLLIVFALTVSTCTFSQEPGRLSFGKNLETARSTSTSCSQTGDTLHIYKMTESGTDMPYRMYVPLSYKDRAGWPVVVMLHGRGLDENSPFISANGLLSHLAEEHGYIVVSPVGFRNDAGFGQRYPLMVGGKEIPSVDVETARLSEIDVMAVVHRVLRDCKVNRSQIYLAGHSMGGLGAWYLGAKYSTIWAGIVVMSAAVLPGDYPLDQLRGIPLMLSQGTEDALSHAEDARQIVRRMNSIGLTPVYFEIPGASHGSTYDQTLRPAFEFFEESRRVTARR